MQLKQITGLTTLRIVYFKNLDEYSLSKKKKKLDYTFNLVYFSAIRQIQFPSDKSQRNPTHLFYFLLK